MEGTKSVSLLSESRVAELLELVVEEEGAVALLAKVEGDGLVVLSLAEDFVEFRFARC